MSGELRIGASRYGRVYIMLRRPIIDGATTMVTLTHDMPPWTAIKTGLFLAWSGVWAWAFAEESSPE